MSGILRLITFDHHLTYLRPLARVGHKWDVLSRDIHILGEPWVTANALSPTARIVGPTAARGLLERGCYDLAVCHTLSDLDAVSSTGIPVIMVFHTSLELERLFGLDMDTLERMAPAIERSTRVFVSPELRQSWNMDGEVVPPCVDTAEYGPYDGGVARILKASHFDRERALLNGDTATATAAAGLPITMFGIETTITGSAWRRTQHEWREAYRMHRLFLNTTRAPYEPGCPFRMLEAMASGMPVVTLEHPFTPITHGVSGFVADTPASLRLRALELLEDLELSTEIGRAAREVVEERFSPAAFADRWRVILAAASQSGVHEATFSAAHSASR